MATNHEVKFADLIHTIQAAKEAGVETLVIDQP